jgi:type IV pilus assembly protein PilB
MRNLETPVSRSGDQIGEYLVRRNIISEQELQDALAQQNSSGVSLGKLLFDSGRISRDELNMAVAATHGIEFISLDPDSVDPGAAHLVPERVVHQYRAIPIRIEGDKVFVAMDSPLNLAARDEIALLTGYTVVPLVTTQKELSLAIQHHFSIEQTTKQEIVEIRMREIKDDTAKPEAAPEEAAPEGAEGSVVRLMDSIVSGAIAAKASDIHLEPQEPEMRVRYRVDGILNDVLTIPRYVEPALVSRVKILADLDISERRSPQDGHYSLHLDGRDYDMRISTMPTVMGEKVVIRVLDKGSTAVDLDRLGLVDADRKAFESLIWRPNGMILITGPTGSGKTTTLYAAMKSLNSGTSNIVTIEDPVEYCLPGINQIQVSPAAGITFAKALRTILRQDPDIIMVGEIRDEETAELAVEAALTGHLVFSTLHTNEAAGAVVRLTEMGVEPYLIASSVLGVVAQRLVRSICLNCRERYEPDDVELADLARELPADFSGLSRGAGCPFCYRTGYRGRSGIFEILPCSDAIRKLIVAKKSSAVIEAAAKEEGMRTLAERGIDKVMEGVTTLEEIRRVIGSGGRDA